jgi:hypothetical protein
MKNPKMMIQALTLVALLAAPAFATTDHKPGRASAKAECLKANPSLKGKALRDCIHSRKAAETPAPHP